MSVFSKRLKECREEIKKQNPSFTQSYVAKEIGVARTTYTAYENGTKTPPIETVELIADFFVVSVDYLLGRTDLKYQFNPDHEYGDFQEFLNDPILNDFLKKDLKNATPAEIAKLRAMYQIMKADE